MSLACQSRTSIVQHVLTLTLCRHYSSPPKPRNLSSSAILERPGVSTEDSIRNVGDEIQIFAREHGRRTGLPRWLLDLQASSSRSLGTQLVPLEPSNDPGIPSGTPRTRGRRKRPLNRPTSTLATLSTQPDLSSPHPTMQNESIVGHLPKDEAVFEAQPDWSGAVDLPELVPPSNFSIPNSPTSVTDHPQPTSQTLPRAFRMDSPAGRLQQVLGSRIPHARSVLEQHIGGILRSTSTLPLELASLQQLSLDYMELLELLVPNTEPGFWTKRTSYFHRSLRELSVAHIRILQELKDRGEIQRSRRLVQSFTPLLVSLIVKPDLKTSSALPNHWTDVNLISAVETILGLGLDLNRFQLSIIMRYMAGHRAIRSPSNRKALIRKGQYPFTVDSIAGTWTLRRQLFDILDQTPFGSLVIDAFRAELTMSTIMDANVIGVDMVFAYPALKERLTEAMLYRDANFQRWVDLSRLEQPVVELENVDDESTSNWNARMALLRTVLQQYLLSPKLRARSPLSLSTDMTPPNPEHILTRMIRELGDPSSSSTTRSTVFLCATIFSLRNRYLKDGHFYKLVNLIRHLGRATTQCPPLPGTVTASLISATRTPSDISTLLILLYRLPPPTTPVRFRRLWRRSLTRMAVVADKHHIPFLSTSRADASAKIIWDKTGWEGLWRSALMRWGYGYSTTQHAAMLLAQDEGRIKNVENNMKRRAAQARKLFKSKAYDLEAMTFPNMQLPSTANVDDVGETDRDKA